MLQQPMQMLVRVCFVIACTVLSLAPLLGSDSTATQTRQLLQDAQSTNNTNVFWTDYFAQENINPDVVRNVVRQLSKGIQTKKQYADQIVALVEAAIVNGNAQPWMYEALTLSLYLKGAPKNQILRAALSAADFCENPIDLLNVAYVMHTALDLKQHAFPLYRQALENMPPQREFYAAAFRLAEELFREQNDEESLRWIGLAILSQEWDGALGNKLLQDAEDALTMLGNRFMKQERKEEAQQLAQEIRETKLRDCVVTVEWTGDAGIDLMIREPSSAICWFKNPRSISGGLLKLSPVTNTTKIGALSDTKKISYVCPRGFNGIYSLVLHKSWGNLSNNLVKVAVETNVVPGESKVEGIAVPVDSEGAIVNFVLESGRRTESVNEAELAVVDSQMNVARRTVDRNIALWRLADDSVLGQTRHIPHATIDGVIPWILQERRAQPLQGSGSGSSGGGGPPGGGGGPPGGGGGPPGGGSGPPGGGSGPPGGGSGPPGTIIIIPPIADWSGPRYVGYQPEVTVLPVGSSLYFSPYDFAVSPDRRYVLMRVNQSYNALRGVTEYNYMGDGSNNRQGGGIMGGGMTGGIGGGGNMGGGMMGGMGGGYY